MGQDTPLWVPGLFLSRHHRSLGRFFRQQLSLQRPVGHSYRCPCRQPAGRVDQQQTLEGGHQGEDKGHPQNTQPTDEHRAEDGGNEGVPQPPQGPRHHLNDHIEQLERQHPAHPRQRQQGDARVRSVDPGKGQTKNHQQQRKGLRQDSPQQQAPAGGTPAPAQIPRPVILAVEGHAGLAKAVEQIVDKDLRSYANGGGRHHIRAQPVDPRLDDHIGNVEHHPLNGRRDANIQDAPQQLPVQAQQGGLHPDRPGLPAQILSLIHI